MNHNKKNRNIGAAALFITFGLLFFVLIVRFITIQYTGEAEGKVLSAKAAQLYLREDVIKAKRGTIYDREGEVIAEDSASYTLIAILDEKVTTDINHPRHVVDPEKTASELAKIIDMSEQDIYSLLTRDGRYQVEFGNAGRDLSHSSKQAIEDLHLPGITFVKDSKRFYPNGIFASHLIGYAQKEQQKDGSFEIVGVTGLENSFNDLLTGKDGSLTYEGDIWDYILPNSKKHVVEPKNGQDIYLTIDKKIQTFLEDAMNKVDEKYTPKRIMAIVADPKTGKILGMAQRPTYHPTTREGIDESWHNELIETSFEPGSTMKIFSLAAAIEKNVFNPNDTFPSGKYYLDQKNPPIRDHNGGVGWGQISYLEGVQRSSNVGFAYLLEKMGTEAWREYMDKFQFGVKTGIDLPNEVAGKILYDWPIEKVTSVYGQGTTVTAIQMIQAMTAIANNGNMMKPYVVDKISNPNDGTFKETKPEVAGKPISKETANKVKDILETVLTSEHGTGEIYQIDGYKVAGKTGTAQIPEPSGGYLEGHNNYIYSFLGLAPSDNPSLIMYVTVEQPKLGENENGSVPVSMIFNTVMKSSLQYLNIEPEKVPDTKITSVPNFSNKSTKETTNLLKESGLIPIIIGKGEKIVKQYPEHGTHIIEGEKVIVKTDGKVTLPDMTGWSKRDVINIARLAGLHVNFTGNGYVYKQNLKANSPVSEGDELVVSFESQEEKIKRGKQPKNTEETE